MKSESDRRVEHGQHKAREDQRVRDQGPLVALQGNQPGDADDQYQDAIKDVGVRDRDERLLVVNDGRFVRVGNGQVAGQGCGEQCLGHQSTEGPLAFIAVEAVHGGPALGRRQDACGRLCRGGRLSHRSGHWPCHRLLFRRWARRDRQLTLEHRGAV